MAITALKDLVPGSGNYGTISYRGLKFSVLKKAELSAKMVYDEADRVVTHIQYTLKISDAVVWAESVEALQGNMAEIQDVLSLPGQELIIDSIGFDTYLSTSAEGTRPDLLWGAKPRAMNFRPTGGERSWMFDWECEFNVSRCADPEELTGDELPLMAFNWEWTGSVDEQGLMTRTITGYIQVPAVTLNDGLLPFNVSDAYDKLSVEVPDGFRRTQNVHSVNKAKNRIDFAIVDVELTSDAYPAGIIEADIRQRYQTQQGGLAFWMASLSGSLTVAPGYPKSLAIVKFLAILRERVEQTKKIAELGGKENPAVVPMGMDITHRLFTRTTDVSVAWTFATDAKTLLEKSGLWDPIEGTEYQEWATSMKTAGVWDAHGVSGLAFQPEDEKLMTVCAKFPFEMVSSISKHPTDGTGSDLDDEEVKTSSITKGGYINYESQVVPVAKRDVVIHKYAQIYKPGDQAYEDHVMQDRAAPDQFVRMVGRATRVGAVPDIPNVDSCGGKPVEIITRGGWQDDLPFTTCFGVSLYRAEWDNLYRIKGQPKVPSDAPNGMPVVHVSSITSEGLNSADVNEVDRAEGEE